MKDLRAIRGRNYILQKIAEGEHQHQDFKYLISDARKIARSISAFANNDGGHLLIGVKDNGIVAGVRNEEDIFVIDQAAELYCDPPQQIEYTAYKVEQGMVVIRAAISRANRRPVCVRESDGTLKAYYRVKDENIVAHPLMVEMWRKRESDDNDSALVMRLSDAESALLSLLNEAGSNGMNERDIAVHLHRSQSETNQLIINLAAVGILNFTFDGTRFVISRAEDEE